jgi:hypothetical protein
MMKGFLLQSSPDLKVAKILRFAASHKAAILVTRVDPKNKDYITLRAVMFAVDDGSWKVLTKIYDDTFPRKAAEADAKLIQDKLKHNPNLQVAAAAAEAEKIRAAQSRPVKPSGAKRAGGKPKTSAEGGKPPKTGTPSGPAKKAATLSSAFNDSPQHQAIIKALRAKGKNEILQTATAVAMVKGKDFANANITYSRQGKTADAQLYLFKEGSAWVAYLELPTKKDHLAVFTALARRYCLTLYKHVESVSFIDNTRKSKDPRKREINLVCSELVNKQWRDHRLTLVYEYDNEKGWRVTGRSKFKQPSPKAKPEKRVSAPPVKSAKPTAKPVWRNAKAAIDEIVQFVGGDPKPVFVVFGSNRQDFIQFHYVREDGSKDIQTVDWLNGKLKGPQVSRLARPCPPISLKGVDFDHVPQIFDKMSRKAKRGDMISVNLSRRSAKGCQQPVWQGIATSSKHSLTITYSIDGRQLDILDYSF